ncbi:OST-HTH/LOTUS domain-containing protein [Nocardia beijingensis]|uniref:OST-HTH/LOTUS domain-containing protein n=1 Tax=Nocardia beijingensis TaxID=95162 RepID=UPI00344F1BF6
MPKNGSSRSKRRARRLAAEQNLRYTEALRRGDSGDHASEQGHDGEASIAVGLTALDALHTTVEQVKATDPADTMATLRTALHALTLTVTANGLIHEALLEADFEIYWPGESFLDGDRRQYLDVAVDLLGSVLPTARELFSHGEVSILAPPDTAPQEYEPVAYHDVAYPPDETDKARQLLLFRTRSVALANKQVWEEVGALLGRVLGYVRETQQRNASRVAALLLEEILNPDSSRSRDDIGWRILAITSGRRSAAELAADDQLVQALHEAVAATAQANGWSLISAVSAELERGGSDFRPERWGYTSAIDLLAATKQFSIRRLPRKGQQVTEVRARGRATGRSTRQ